MEIRSFIRKLHVQFSNNPDRHNARQKLPYCLLPDPPHFSLPSRHLPLMPKFSVVFQNHSLGVQTACHITRHKSPLPFCFCLSLPSTVRQQQSRLGSPPAYKQTVNEWLGGKFIQQTYRNLLNLFIYEARVFYLVISELWKKRWREKF